MRWRYLALAVALLLPLGAVFLEERQFVHEVQPAMARLRIAVAVTVGLAALAYTIGALVGRERGAWGLGATLLGSLVLLLWGGFWCGLAELDLFGPTYQRTIHVAKDRAVHVYQGGWLDPDTELYVSSGGIRQRRLVTVHDCPPDRATVVGQTVTACAVSCDLVTLTCVIGEGADAPVRRSLWAPGVRR